MIEGQGALKQAVESSWRQAQWRGHQKLPAQAERWAAGNQDTIQNIVGGHLSRVAGLAARMEAGNTEGGLATVVVMPLLQ